MKRFTVTSEEKDGNSITEVILVAVEIGRTTGLGSIDDNIVLQSKCNRYRFSFGPINIAALYIHPFVAVDSEVRERERREIQKEAKDSLLYSGCRSFWSAHLDWFECHCRVYVVHSTVHINIDFSKSSKFTLTDCASISYNSRRFAFVSFRN